MKIDLNYGAKTVSIGIILLSILVAVALGLWYLLSVLIAWAVIAGFGLSADPWTAGLGVMAILLVYRAIR